jgi:membrane protease YdiL (CAAX protease family)
MNRNNAVKTVTFIFLAYGISWLVWLSVFFVPQFSQEARLGLLVHHCAAYGPIAAGIITSSLFERREGRRAYLKQVFRFPKKVFWYLFSILTPLSLFLMAGVFQRAIFGTFPHPRHISIFIQDTATPGALRGNNGLKGLSQGILVSWSIWTLTYGVGEEAGWRGFLFRHLLKRRSPLTSALITSLFWAGWHLPLFLLDPGYKQMTGFGAVGWLVSLVSGSILLSWMTLEANKSVIPAVLWHGTFNTVVSGAGFFVSAFCSMAVVAASLLVWICIGPTLISKKNTGEAHVLIRN